MSRNVPAGTANSNGASSVAIREPIGRSRAGASFVFSTKTSKVSLTVAPPGSEAVTVTLTVPTSALPGMPLKAPVAESNASQPGNADPSASVALSTSASAAFVSSKVSLGSWNANDWSSRATWSAIARLRPGGTFAG